MPILSNNELAPQIADWVRTALTGDATTGPADAGLILVIPSVLRTLVKQNPCVADTNGLVTLAGDDLDAFLEWVALTVAARYVTGPAGRVFGMRLVERKTGTSTRQYAQPDVTMVARDFDTYALQARLRVSCIRASIAASNQRTTQPSGGFALPGRRRSIGQPTTIQGEALGAGSSGISTDDPFLLQPGSDPL